MAGADDRDDPAQQLIAKGACPCGCGSALPGSGRATSCFGCSVGKAEVTFIRESLASGRPLAEILIALRELVLVEVFADYSEPGLRAVWERARRVADELGQHRVVLRTPGLSTEARRTLAIAECARGTGSFTRLQSALIAHTGPWDEASVLTLALAVMRGAASQDADDPEAPLRRRSRSAWTLESLRHCAANANLSAQIERDRSHAKERAMQSFPAVSVNREPIPDSPESLRRAIRAAVQEGSI